MPVSQRWHASCRLDCGRPIRAELTGCRFRRLPPEEIAMSCNRNKLVQLAVMGAAGLLAVRIGTTSAKEEASVLVKKPASSGRRSGWPAFRHWRIRLSSRPPRPEHRCRRWSCRPQAVVSHRRTHREASVHAAGRTAFARKGKLVGAEPMPAPPGAAPPLSVQSLRRIRQRLA